MLAPSLEALLGLQEIFGAEPRHDSQFVTQFLRPERLITCIKHLENARRIVVFSIMSDLGAFVPRAALLPNGEYLKAAAPQHHRALLEPISQ